MTLFRLDASILPATSSSREIADIVEQEWTAGHPHDEVIRRHLGSQPLPAEAWADAVTAGFTPEADRTEGQRRATALAAELVEELTSADAVLLAVPLYNFGVSQHVKAWIDLVVAGSEPGAALLEGTPVVLATVRGGAYGAGTPREGWDHATPWMRRILADLWGLDLTVTEAEFTLVGVNPAMDQFKELAAELRAEAEAVARRHGAELGRRRSEIAA